MSRRRSRSLENLKNPRGLKRQMYKLIDEVNKSKNSSTSVNPDQKNPDQKNPAQKNADQKNPDQKNSKPEESNQTNINHYQFESVRFESFKNWPYLLSRNCAASGFYYTGVVDEVKCFACQAAISNWDSHYNLRRFHKPNCKFSSLSNNVPMSVNPNTISTDCQTESRTKGVRAYNLAELSDSASNKRQNPPKTEYNIYDNRLESYAKWPEQLSSLKEQLAAAGLCYTGKDDITKCFTCNVEISHWALDDDPWKKHANYSKMCEYLFIIKGRKYVYNVIKKTLPKQVNKFKFHISKDIFVFYTERTEYFHYFAKRNVMLILICFLGICIYGYIYV